LLGDIEDLREYYLMITLMVIDSLFSFIIDF